MPPRLKRRSDVELEGSPAPTRQRRDEPASDDPDDSDDYNAQAIGDATTGGPPPVDQMVKKLVRLAMATEFTRQPLRRGDISTKVLDPYNRMFKVVFNGAQKALHDTFGMKLVELPSKERVTMAQKRAAQRSGATASQGGSSATSSKSYILTSLLPSTLRRPTIIAPGKNPSAAAEAEYTGFYTCVVAMIMLSQGSRLSEGKLDRFLQRSNAGEYFQGEKTENVLKKMERNGYITKIRDREPGGEETVEWILGPRAKIEIGEKGIASFVRTVYDVADAELEMLEDKLERSLGKGAFKRKTRKASHIDGGDNDVDGEDGETADRSQADAANALQRRRTRGGQENSPAAGPSTRRQRRSEMVDDAAEDDEEEDDEDEDEDNDGEEEDDDE